MAQGGNALDFGECCGAPFGHALAVHRRTGVGVARGGFERAGLPQARVDARFERGAAFGGGHIDIAVSDLDGDGLVTGRCGKSRRGHSGKGKQGESETHGKTPKVERGVSGHSMPLTGIRLLFETLVQCTRVMCKCEIREIGSKDCNRKMRIFREPADFPRHILCCTAK